MLIVAARGTDSSEDTFRAQALKTIGRLRGGLETVIHSFTDGLTNSRELQSHIGLDAKLSWQVFKLLGPVETLSAASYVPGPLSMKRMIEVVREKKNVPAERLAELANAFESYEEFVRESAGDRKRFETMVMSLSDSPEAQNSDLQHRKAAFQAHGHFLGTEVDVKVATVMSHQDVGSRRWASVSLQYHKGLRRLRPDAQMKIDRARFTKEETVVALGPLDKRAMTSLGVPVVPGFSSSPLPPMEVRPGSFSEVVLRHPELGVGRELDVVTGRRWGPRELPTPEGGANISAIMAAPIKLLVIDVLLHESGYPRMKHIDERWYAHIRGEEPAEIEQSGIRVPMREQMEYMGKGSDVVRIREVPRYRELLQYACDEMAWDLDRMNLYRLRVEYPIMETAVLLRLKEQPQ